MLCQSCGAARVMTTHALGHDGPVRGRQRCGCLAAPESRGWGRDDGRGRALAWASALGLHGLCVGVHSPPDRGFGCSHTRMLSHAHTTLLHPNAKTRQSPSTGTTWLIYSFGLHRVPVAVPGAGGRVRGRGMGMDNGRGRGMGMDNGRGRGQICPGADMQAPVRVRAMTASSRRGAEIIAPGCVQWVWGCLCICLRTLSPSLMVAFAHLGLYFGVVGAKTNLHCHAPAAVRGTEFDRRQRPPDQHRLTAVEYTTPSAERSIKRFCPIQRCQWQGRTCSHEKDNPSSKCHQRLFPALVGDGVKPDEATRGSTRTFPWLILMRSYPRGTASALQSDPHRHI